MTATEDETTVPADMAVDEMTAVMSDVTTAVTAVVDEMTDLQENGIQEVPTQKT